MLGPEGLGRSGAADSDKAGWFTVQRRSDQFTAGYGDRRRLQTVTHLMVGWSLILVHGRNVIQYFGVVSP